jgi:hypothetical protein
MNSSSGINNEYVRSPNKANYKKHNRQKEGVGHFIIGQSHLMFNVTENAGITASFAMVDENEVVLP